MKPAGLFFLSYFPPKLRRILAILLLIFCTWLAGLTASNLPTEWNPDRNQGLALLFKWRGAQPAPDEAVIVSIDQESSLRLSQAQNPARWDRLLHARVIDELKSRGADTISFVLLFGQREAQDCTNSDSDRALGEAIRQAGNVLLFMDIELQLKELEGLGSVRMERNVPALECLANAAVGNTPFPLPKDASRLHKLWLFKNGSGDTPSLPVTTLAYHLKEELHNICTALNESMPDKFSCHQIESPQGKFNELLRSLRLELHTNPEITAQLSQQASNNSSKALLLKLLSGSKELALNFYGPPKTIPSISFHQLIAPENQKLPDLRGKTAFIGYSNEGSSDQQAFRTLFHNSKIGTDFSGSEIAATAFLNLLHDHQLKQTAPWINALILLCFASLITLLFMNSRPLWISLEIPLIVIFISLTAFLLFTYQQRWIPFVTMLLVQLPIIFAGTLLWRFSTSRREKREVTTALQKLLPQEAVDRIQAGGNLTLEGTTLSGVCLFTDASQYTALSETFEPEKLRGFLNRYYSTLFQPVSNHSGFVSDVIGDAMMAIWSRVETSKISEQKMRENSCLAALEIIEEVNRFNEENPETPLPTRIGIDAGPISLGNVGAGDHYEFRAVGDTVNTASRIENLNKTLGTQLLASQRALVDQNLFLTRNLGAFRLKGKSRDTEIHEIMGHADQVSSSMLGLKQQFDLAILHLQQEQYPVAIEHLQVILQQYPDDGPSLYYLEKTKAKTI